MPASATKAPVVRLRERVATAAHAAGGGGGGGPALCGGRPQARGYRTGRCHAWRRGTGGAQRSSVPHVLRAGSTPAPVDPLACLLLQQEALRRHFELVTWSTECL